MRTAALFAIAVLFSAAGRAAAPKPEDWYTPESYWDVKNSAELYYDYDPKKDPPWQKSLVTLDDEGEIIVAQGMDETIKKNFALKTALGAIQMALKNTKQIQTLGKNLNDLLVITGFDIQTKDGGRYTVRVGDGSQSIKDVLGSATKRGVPAKSDRKLADGFTVDWRIDGSGDDAKYSLQLKGANNVAADAGNNEFWNNYAGDYYLPMIYDSPNNSPNNDIRYFKFGGIDTTVLEAYQFKNVTGKSLTLKNWQDSAHNMNVTMSQLFTDAGDMAATLRRTTDILVRTTENGPGSAVVDLDYVPIGDVISGLGLPPDGVSIEDHVGGNTTNLAIKGWHNGTATPNVVLANIMLSKAAEGEQPDKEYTVLVRGHDNTLGSNDLYYAAIGDLYKMSWSTNWYDAVKDIVDAEQVVMGQHLTNLVYSAAGDPDTVYNRLVEITKRAENAGDRVDDTYTHLTNLTKSAAGEVDSLYAHITNLTASARDESEKAKSTYAHILALSESADNETDAIFDRITNVMHKAETAQAAADSSYAHLTNLITTAGNPEAVYHHITNLVYETQYTFITNVVEYMQTFENWTYVTNYLVMYMGVEQKKGDGPVAPPPVDKKDDPYDGGYEHDPVKDSLLPVKTALLVNDATNKPMETIKAEHMFDFDVIDTNAVPVSGEVRYLAQLRGFCAADASSTPKIPVKRKKTDIQRPAGEADYDPERTTNYALDWMDYPTALFGATTNDLAKVTEYLKKYNITNILHTVVSNNEWLTEMSTNFFNRVRAETLLDNDSVWTNGARQIEIKGYHSTAPFTVPYAEWGEITNLVDRGGWEDQGWYEEVIDPATGATNEVWHENIVWVPDWQEEVVEGKKMVWEKYPLADSEAWSRYGVAFWCTLTNDILAVEDEETGNVKGSVKALSLYGFEGANNAAIAYKHYPTSEDPEGSRPQLRWTSPQDDYLPGEDYKYSPISNGMDIKWVPAASAVRVVGTDGSEAVVGVAAQTNTLTFASAADSNVQVGVQGDGNGNVTITIGVYYLNNAGVQPPYAE